jgi:hypothetical protein
MAATPSAWSLNVNEPRPSCWRLSGRVCELEARAEFGGILSSLASLTAGRHSHITFWRCFTDCVVGLIWRRQPARGLGRQPLDVLTHRLDKDQFGEPRQDSLRTGPARGVAEGAFHLLGA